MALRTYRASVALADNTNLEPTSTDIAAQGGAFIIPSHGALVAVSLKLRSSTSAANAGPCQAFIAVRDTNTNSETTLAAGWARSNSIYHQDTALYWQGNIELTSDMQIEFGLRNDTGSTVVLSANWMVNV